MIHEDRWKSTSEALDELVGERHEKDDERHGKDDDARPTGYAGLLKRAE